MQRSLPIVPFSAVLERRPDAAARVSGSADYPHIRGTVRFYQTMYGVVVAAELAGLPVTAEKEPVFGFHIHTGGHCRGTPDDPFAEALMHYDPGKRPHPYHAGDLPPLFGTADGYAFSAVLTDRFAVSDIRGRTVVVHAMPDDFTTQPAGNSGARIACGEIR